MGGFVLQASESRKRILHKKSKVFANNAERRFYNIIGIQSEIK